MERDDTECFGQHLRSGDPRCDVCRGAGQQFRRIDIDRHSRKQADSLDPLAHWRYSRNFDESREKGPLNWRRHNEGAAMTDIGPELEKRVDAGATTLILKGDWVAWHARQIDSMAR